MRCKIRSNTNRGFTLIEILVGIGIVSVLAALLFSVFTRVREQGRRTSCASNLKQIGLALLQYAEDNSGTFPPEHTYSKFKGLVQPYISSTQVFQCPSDSGEDANSTPYYQRRLNNFSSYSINDHPGSCVTYVAPRGITGFSLGQVQSPTRVALVFETVGAFPWSWHDGIGHALNNNRSNMCFVDGHVKYTRMYYENKTPDFTDWGYCYDPPGTANKTSVYEYQWSATP